MVTNSENLQIYINHNWHSNSIEMWVIETDGIRRFNLSFDNENKLMRTEMDEMQPLTVGNTLKPFLNLSALFASILFNKISEYNSKNGVKTPDENLLIGKLKATEEHLNDMREFSKKLLDASLNAR